MKKDTEHISVNTIVRATFVLHNLNQCQATAPSSLSYSCSEQLVMTVCGNFAFNWIFCVYLLIQLIN